MRAGATAPLPLPVSGTLSPSSKQAALGTLSVYWFTQAEVTVRASRTAAGPGLRENEAADWGLGVCSVQRRLAAGPPGLGGFPSSRRVLSEIGNPVCLFVSVHVPSNVSFSASLFCFLFLNLWTVERAVDY